jgi:hypothetical protein
MLRKVAAQRQAGQERQVRRGRRAARVAAVVAVVAGGAVIAAIIAGKTFSRADAGDQATDLVRSELSVAGLRQHHADLDASEAGIQQLFDEALPAFAQQQGVTPAEYQQLITTRYPAVARLQPPQARADGFKLARGILTNLERHQHDFAEADAIPVPWLPMRVGPWFGTGVGVLLVGLGLWGLVRPGGAALIAAGVLGALMVVAPLATRYPQKAEGAHDLLATLNVTPAIAAHTRDVLEDAKGAADEMEQRVYPDVAAALHVTPQELDATIAQRYPAVAGLRTDLQSIFQRFEHRVQIRERGVSVIPEAKKFPLQSALWWAVVPGAIVAIACAAALLAGRSRSAGPMKATQV